MTRGGDAGLRPGLNHCPFVMARRGARRWRREIIPGAQHQARGDGAGHRRPWLPDRRCIPTLLAFLLLVPLTANAQSVSIDLGAAGQPGATARIVQLTALVTVLSLAPSLLVMMTAFTRIVIVLSLLRNALSTQGTPPNVVLIGLALFLSFFVMQPTLEQAWINGIQPMTEGRIAETDGIRLATEPFHRFMSDNVREEDLGFFLELARQDPLKDGEAAPWRILVPAFLVGELRRAFEMGFLLFLPFLVIDMVVASLLMSLGMMMLPPNAVSLPFKLIFFVLVDGWKLVAGSLVQSFTSG
ncbi:MAG: flagellar type III secretion system pore protein FliP [Acetobacteraceae bacterium]